MATAASNMVRLIGAGCVIFGAYQAYRVYNGKRFQAMIEPKARDLKNAKDQTEMNVQAFLKTIRDCEGTAGANGYRTLFGGTLFSNMSDHPYLTGEWKGKKLSDTMCRNAGLSPGCISTAAGAYQILVGTWRKCKRNVAGLNDFSPESQDKAAIWLIDNRGALSDVKNGNVDAAFAKCNPEWASLPGATYGQPTKTLAFARTSFISAGGRIA